MTLSTAAIRPGNTKLGPGIFSWSLPAGKSQTCPGETGVCARRCYAMRGHYVHSTVKALYLRNLQFSRTEDFVGWFVATLRSHMAQVLRVHTSGDFYDQGYIEKWQQIVQASPNTQFFAYTRSWRVPGLLPDLVQLGRLPNMSLWWSTDRESGEPPLVRGIRQAYMAVNDADAATAPIRADLVFRVQRTSVLKRANGVQVCPPENGVQTREKITCTKCGICWKKANPHWEPAFREALAAAVDIVAPLPKKATTNARTYAKRGRGRRLHHHAAGARRPARRCTSGSG